MTPSTLARETFKTSRLLEYFSEKELILQTGHEPERWPEVVVKELVDNSLDGCEEASVLPDITVSITENALTVGDNGPGIPGSVIEDVLDYSVRASSKDAYISPTRGAQGNALKTVMAIPYVLSGCEHGEVTITSQGQRHRVSVTVDRIAQRPEIRSEVEDGVVRNGTEITLTWPDSALLLRPGRREGADLTNGGSLKPTPCSIPTRASPCRILPSWRGARPPARSGSPRSRPVPTGIPPISCAA